MKFLIATKNQGKFKEIKEALQDLPVESVSLQDLGILDDVFESGRTHEANAVIKAQYFFEKTGLPTLAEDSGIYVDAFPGELGVFTRRFRGMENKTDDEWVQVFLYEIRNVPEPKRGAGFICVAAVILDKKSFHKPFIFRGETRGRITHKLEAPLQAGIPLSSCFVPDGADKVYAALGVDVKNAISHRGKAIHAAKEFLKTKML